MSDKGLYQHQNYDNIFNRSVIGGLLNLLNHRLVYQQVWADDVIEDVTVPFAYNMANNKRNQDFVQLNYTFFGRECFSDKMIDGKFDMLPRFLMTYNGSQIDAANITNRYVQCEYQKDEGGKIQSYVAFVYSIPLTMNFEFEGYIDNIDTAFKIEQAIRETFYKNQTFNVLYKGMKIGCRVGFPESYTIDKTVSYAFEQDDYLKMNFSLAVECYQPCFDDSMSMPAENRIEHIAYDFSKYGPNMTKRDRKVKLTLDPIDTTQIHYAGSTLPITWKQWSNVADVCTVILYYITPDGDKHIIDLPILSGGKYDWKIPNLFSNLPKPEITFIEDDIAVIKKPVVNIYPNADGTVSANSFRIDDPGKFSGTGYIQVSFEFLDEQSNLTIYDCYAAYVTADEGLKDIFYLPPINGTYIEVLPLFEDSETPYYDSLIRTKNRTDAEPVDYVSFVEDPYYISTICRDMFTVTNTKRMKFDVAGFATKITLGIAYPLDTKIFDEIHNVLIA